MKKALFLSIAAVFIICLSIGMVGCGGDEDGEEENQPVEMTGTAPANGGEMPANGSLVITFNGTVTDVKVNGTSADVTGAKATWKGQGLQTGSQTFMIEWTDAEGNTGSDEVTLNITAVDSTPPSVSEISIADGATDVESSEVNDAGITIKFSEPINTSKSTIALLDGNGNELSWTPEWNDDNTEVVLKTTPTTKLRGGIDYTLSISSYFDVADNAGNPVSVSFTTVGVALPTEDLQIWLKSDAGVVLSGSNVMRWEDQSGNGVDAEQATASKQPGYDERVINNLPVLTFDGQDDELSFTLPVNGLENITLFIVSAATQPGIDVATHYANRATMEWQEIADWGTVHITTLQEGLYARFGTGQTQPLPVGIKYDTPIGEEFVFGTAVMDGTRDRVYLNGELVYDEDAKRTLAPVDHTGDIGYFGRGYQFNWPGMIAEAIVYTRTLSDDELDQVHTYLSDKYAIK